MEANCMSLRRITTSTKERARRLTMKDHRVFLAAVIAALALFITGCSSSGSGPSADADGDGVPNVADSFPDDPDRFAAFVTHDLVVPQGTGLFSVARDLNDAANPLIVGAAERTDNLGILQAVHWTFDSAAGNPVAAVPLSAVDGAYSSAYAVNNKGVMVGEAQKETDFVPVYWTTEGATPVELSLAVERVVLVEENGEMVEEVVTDDPLARGAAYGINNLGEIVGELVRGDGTVMAVLWRPGEIDGYLNPVELTSLGGAEASAIAISDGGWIVGESVTATGASRATLWEIGPDGLPREEAINLGTLLGHERSIALGVDNEGRIVGESEDTAGQISAVLWTPAAGDGEVAGGFYNNQSRGLHASAQAIADGNRFVGHAGPEGGVRAVVWDVRTVAANNFDHVVTGASADFIPVGSFSQACGMNQGGMVVGISSSQGFLAVPQ
jgi:uncharacterized membrane protein